MNSDTKLMRQIVKERIAKARREERWAKRALTQAKEKMSAAQAAVTAAEDKLRAASRALDFEVAHGEEIGA